MTKFTFLHVFIGAGIGGVLRYLASYIPYVHAYPLGTFFVNICGSFLIGILIAWLSHANILYLKPLLITGLLGGFTTFSSFSLETITLLQTSITRGLLYSFSTIIISLSFTACGLWLGKLL